MSSSEINVTLSTLPYQEKIWRDQAKVMGSISSEAGSVQWPGNSGYFVQAVDAYNEACQNIKILCGQGQSEMNNIADALQQSAITYHDTEQTITGQIRKIGH